MTIEVKIGIVPGAIRMVGADAGTTVRDLLDLAEFEDYEDGYAVTVAGETADLDTEVNTSCSVLLTRKIKGN